jgi:spermidine/putrescine transport system substrate-binding protein
MTERDKDLLSITSDVAKGRISRRQFLERGLAMGLSVSALGTILAACGEETPTGETGASPPPMDQTKPEFITLYNWSDYMTAELKDAFREETGIEVKEANFASNEELLAKLRAGGSGYDVAVPSDFMVTTMIKSGLLRPLDMSLIPSFEQADEQFQNAEYDDPSSDANQGNKYSVPYQWGVTAYAVRTDKVPRSAVTGWADLWKPEYEGEIQMLDSERDTYGAALKLLGYSLNTTDEAEIQAGTDKLIEQKPLVFAYDSVNVKRAMVQGVAFVHTYSGYYMLGVQALGGDQAALDLAPYVLPTEGYPLWADNLVIPTSSEKAYGAHLFMDFMLRPENQGALSTFAFTFPVTKAAEPYTDQLVFSQVPSDEDLERAERIADVGEAQRLYTDGWRQVKSA